MALLLSLFLAGILTILLPCILPLIPIVLGVSIADRDPWRPFATIAGMVLSFVVFTYLLLTTLNQFVELADYIRLATYYLLLLFGVGFITSSTVLQLTAALFGSVVFFGKGYAAVIGAAAAGMASVLVAGTAASKLQRLGASAQSTAEASLGRESKLAAFIVGLTMGLVWVPCAGPALGFVFALVREQPGSMALAALLAYGLGTALPLVLVGYGGQAATKRVLRLSRVSGVIKQASGVILVFTAIGLYFDWFTSAGAWLEQRTRYGALGSSIEAALFPEQQPPPARRASLSSSLPALGSAREFEGLGPWHNSEPLTLQHLRGKVLLIDFWTYSCVNCVRTLPYLKGYWSKYRDKPFVLIGIHTPEFVFEKSRANVANAIKRYDITYPVAQDNNYETWNIFDNRYWPAKYLIDADGVIRYTHFGEGEYEETDHAISLLLNELGVSAGGPPMLPESNSGAFRETTPETYLGSRGSASLGKAAAHSENGVDVYEASTITELHKFYLVGSWKLENQERQVLQSEQGEIHLRFLGSECNLVVGMQGGAKAAQIQFSVDGQSRSELLIDRHDMFRLYSGPYGEHELRLIIKGPGLEAYAFTFG